MNGDLPPPAGPVTDRAESPPKRQISWMAIAVAFLLGVVTVAAMLPVIDRWRTREGEAPVARPTATPAAAPAAAAASAAMPITLNGLAAREAALNAKLDAIEVRMTMADAGSRAAAAYATRAESLLVAVAARRAIDRGVPLGYIENQLNARFGATQPAAVATIIAASRTPTTREDLRLALEQIAPELAGSSFRDGFWRSIRRGLAELVVLRRESTPSPRASDRLDRARRLIDAGNVEAALAEVARMPGAASATSWIDAAKRFNATRRALSTLEQAAVDTAPPAATAPAAPTYPEPTLSESTAAEPPSQNPAGLLPGG